MTGITWLCDSAHSSEITWRANGTTTKKRRGTKRRGATDWSRLRRGTPAEIRQGIGADPEAHATDAQFWKTAKVVLPTPKEIVTMRLDADLLRWFRRERGTRSVSTPSSAPTWKRTSRLSFVRKSSEGKCGTPTLAGCPRLVCPRVSRLRTQGWAPGRQPHCLCLSV